MIFAKLDFPKKFNYSLFSLFSLIHFEKLIEFEEALIGRMGPQTQSSDWETQAQNTEGGINSCHNPKAYSAEPTAMQFGEDPNSYVRLDYLRQAFHGKNSTIKLSFRTFYTDGILLVIPVSQCDMLKY